MAPRARTITVQVNPEADFSGVITDVGRQFRKIKEEATKVESGVTKAMRSAGKRIVEPFRKSAADIPAAYDGIGGRIRANLARAAANVGDVASRISKPFREAADKIKGVAGRIAQPFRNIGSKLKGVGQDIIAPFRKAADGIPKEFDGVGDRIKSKFSGLGGLLAGGLGVGAGVALAGSVGYECADPEPASDLSW